MGSSPLKTYAKNSLQFLGDLLVEKNILSPDQISLISQEHTLTGRGFVKLILDYDLIEPQILKNLWSEFYDFAPLEHTTKNLHLKDFTPEILNQLKGLSLQELWTTPLNFDSKSKTLHIAQVDCQDIKTQDLMRQIFKGANIRTYAATVDEIFECLRQLFPKDQTLDSFLWKLSKLDLEKNPTWAMECVNLILTDAIAQGASDIHLQPHDRFIALRYRIDGVLMQRCTLHLRFWPMVATRFKILSQMNITQTRLPQMGRLTHIFEGRAVDCRLSTHPMCYGESIVIRLLDQKKRVLGLKDLGLPQSQQELLSQMGHLPEGMIIFTGPTGSGKSTSLYALLKQLPAQAKNIVTLEDPIEYELSGIRQSQVDEPLGFTFEEGIRSLLRQDPDVILIGEIRDAPTAKMALRAALTGHLVLTTLHTNDVFGVIQRFEDLGISPHTLCGVIKCVISQRLVRLLCNHCKEKQGDQWVPGQCHHCHYTGYKGRIPIAECLPWGPHLDDVIHGGCKPGDFMTQAQSHGFSPIQSQAQILIDKGLTTLKEVQRVIPWVDHA